MIGNRGTYKPIPLGFIENCWPFGWLASSLAQPKPFHSPQNAKLFYGFAMRPLRFSHSVCFTKRWAEPKRGCWRLAGCRWAGLLIQIFRFVQMMVGVADFRHRICCGAARDSFSWKPIMADLTLIRLGLRD